MIECLCVSVSQRGLRVKLFMLRNMSTAKGANALKLRKNEMVWLLVGKLKTGGRKLALERKLVRKQRLFCP